MSKWDGPVGAQRLPRPGMRKRGEWVAALRDVLARYETSEIQRGTALRAIARKVVAMALEGDLLAVKEIGDRLDGKPAQSTTVELPHRRVEEMSDEQLLAIIAASGHSIVDEEEGEILTAELH